MAVVLVFNETYRKGEEICTKKKKFGAYLWLNTVCLNLIGE